jgi:hypothetical protein
VQTHIDIHVAPNNCHCSSKGVGSCVRKHFRSMWHQNGRSRLAAYHGMYALANHRPAEGAFDCCQLAEVDKQRVEFGADRAQSC